jgi:hypothetical protein
MTDVAAPRSVNYTDTLPLAIASTQNRRSFYPQNGQAFTDTGSNIIRIDVNADGLLDTQQSYLEFTLNNLAVATRCLDQGHVWIKRLTIESGGVILEDINNYNRLVAGILQPAQGSAAYTGEMQVAQGGSSQSDQTGGTLAAAAGPVATFQNLLPATIDNTAAGVGAPLDPMSLDNGTQVIPAFGVANNNFTGQYHLSCGFLNMDKYLPLVLMGQGFTIQLELEVGANIGITTQIAGPVDTPAIYSITNVKYVAHIVDMQRDFYDMLRNLQSQSGGSLMIGASTFRHFSHTYSSDAGTEDVNITARVRNLENLLWVSTATANVGNSNVYNLSCGSSLGTEAGSYNVFVGAVRYPSNQVTWNVVTNKGESYQELRKCFGSLGSINHGGFLNSCTYLSSISGGDVALNGGIPNYSPMGISFRSWRHELEDGVDTSSSALPIRLALQLNQPAAGGVAQTMDIYAQATVLFYFNMDGSVTANI